MSEYIEQSHLEPHWKDTLYLPTRCLLSLYLDHPHPSKPTFILTTMLRENYYQPYLCYYYHFYIFLTLEERCLYNDILLISRDLLSQLATVVRVLSTIDITRSRF